MKPAIRDVAACEAMGSSFSAIAAVGATQVFVYVQEWV